MQHYLFNSEDELHIWKYEFQESIIEDAQIKKVLSKEEQLRASQFFNEADRKRYYAAHLFLKHILSLYTHSEADQMEIIFGLNNKPKLKNNPAIFFNLSYRKDMALLGISNLEFIGVDIEYPRALGDISSFISNYFSIEEQKKVLSLKNEEEQLELIFNFWTMKEAVIKALALGFSQPLTQYNLCDFINEPCGYPNFDSKNRWYIQSIEMEKDYKAAFAMKSEKVKVKFLDYEK